MPGWPLTIRYEDFSGFAPHPETRSLGSLLTLDNGVATLRTPGCQVEGQGAFSMSRFGGWTFHAGTILVKECTDDAAADEANRLLALLPKAVEWSRDGSLFAFTNEDSPAWEDDAWTVRFVEPTENGFSGEWRPVSLKGASWFTNGASMGGVSVAPPPYTWTLSIDSSVFTFPETCNGETEKGYTAGKDGWFSFGDPGDGSRGGADYKCDDTSKQQAGVISAVLRSATTWAVTDGKLVFTRPAEGSDEESRELVLERVT
jgi:hypothetical protein